MRSPTKNNMVHIKYLCRYLIGTESCGIFFPYTSPAARAADRLHETHAKQRDMRVEIFSDSDWSGHAVTRTSASSGVVFCCGALILSYSKTQRAISLSNCESEICAATHGASEAILVRELWRFVANQENVQLILRMDSSSGRQAPEAGDRQIETPCFALPMVATDGEEPRSPCIPGWDNPEHW